MLQIWLPLNKEGDFNNRGLADITVTNNGASYDANGKIGGCYKFTPGSATNTAGNWLKTNITSSDIIEQSGSFSLACWFICTANAWGNGCGLITCNLYHAYGFGLYLKNNGGFDFMMCNDTLETEWLPNFTTPKNEWTHVCVTYDKDTRKLSLYINGEFKAENTMAFDWLHRANEKITIGCGLQGGWGYTLTGSMNDVRIYDHCLSPKEVKEISKGLVLHYPLNDVVGKNLSPNTNWEKKSSNEYMQILNTYTDPGLGECTFSCEMKVATGNPSVNIYFGDGTYTRKYNYSVSNISVNGVANGKLSQEWQRIVCKLTFTNSTPDSTVMPHVSTYYTYGSGAIVSVRKPKLEKGWNPNPVYTNSTDPDIMYDSSGYQNDGTITGTLTTSNDSPRYDKCGTNTTEVLINKQNFSLVAPYTISFWRKPIDYTTNSSNTSRTSVTLNNTNVFFTYINYPYFPTGYGYGYDCYIYNNYWSDQKWHLVTCTNNGSTARIFIDGMLVKSGVNIGELPVNKRLQIANYQGSLSDFRIYTTDLSSDIDANNKSATVEELYNTSAIIDNEGNSYCYEFEENENSRELAPRPISGVTFYNDGSYTIQGHTWPASEYIPINPIGKTYYYDIEFSNVQGNLFYIGFERYDSNKQSGQNAECLYVFASKLGVDRKRITGTINLATANGNTAAYTKLRILNDWDNTGNPDYIGTIYHLSLKEVITLGTKVDINKNGIIECAEFIEQQTATIDKSNNITANQLIEI